MGLLLPGEKHPVLSISFKAKLRQSFYSIECLAWEQTDRDKWNLLLAAGPSSSAPKLRRFCQRLPGPVGGLQQSAAELGSRIPCFVGRVDTSCAAGWLRVSFARNLAFLLPAVPDSSTHPRFSRMVELYQKDVEAFWTQLTLRLPYSSSLVEDNTFCDIIMTAFRESTATVAQRTAEFWEMKALDAFDHTTAPEDLLWVLFSRFNCSESCLPLNRSLEGVDVATFGAAVIISVCLQFFSNLHRCLAEANWFFLSWSQFRGKASTSALATAFFVKWQNLLLASFSSSRIPYSNFLFFSESFCPTFTKIADSK